MNRRRFVAGLTMLAPIAGSRWSIPAEAAPQTAGAFFGGIRDRARELAAQPYKEPDKSLPKELQDLSYDVYRSIRFRPDRALWRGERLPFEVQFFHRGFIFTDRVDIHEVIGGQARPIAYTPDLFDFGKAKPPTEIDKVGFAGFRLHAPINRRDYYDEVGVFLGASYFRAVAKGQVYGLSARGLSIATGDQKGEEFPAFRSFWIEKPARNARSIVVHALLDSKSGAAAFRFTIRPGQTTVYEVDATIYPRVDIPQAGIGSLTSMFFFDSNDRVGVDDFRPAVHDSDGLAIQNGRGEEIWRPLSNPRDLQISLFSDNNPRSFGLFQRERDFHAYEDIESRFEKRPSAWVEPIGGWGEGAVQLVEIPTKEEIHDNIVAFWRPRDPLKAKSEYNYAYRINWGAPPVGGGALAQFTKTRIGAGPGDTRLFVLEVRGEPRAIAENVNAAVTADKGEIRNLVTQPNPVTGGIRVSFELLTKGEPVIELRAQLMRGEAPVSEVWLYRLTP